MHAYRGHIYMHFVYDIVIIHPSVFENATKMCPKTHIWPLSGLLGPIC